MSTITQVISNIPQAGSRGVDIRDDFVTKQEAFQDQLSGSTVSELNTFASQANTVISEINVAKADIDDKYITITNQPIVGGYSQAYINAMITNDGSDNITINGGYFPIGGGFQVNSTDMTPENGTWTPAFSYSGDSTGFTYFTQQGWYTKVGKMVTASCYLRVNVDGSATGDLRIEGLPFTSSSQASYSASASIGLWERITVDKQLTLDLQTNRTYLDVRQTNSSNVSATITDTETNANFFIKMSVTYQAN